MKNTTLLLATAALAAFAGCSKDNTSSADSREVKTTITATAGSESRSYIENDKAIKWNDDDAIGVFHGSSWNSKFDLTTNNGASATFEGMASNEEGNYIAYFPYDDLVYTNEEDNDDSANDIWYYYYYLSLPNAVKSTQTMAVGGFDPKAMTTVGYGATTDLQFRNACGLAKVTLQDPSATIKSIRIESGDGTTVLAGEGTIDLNHTDYPVLEMSTEGATVVSLTSAEGIALDAEGKSFYFVLPPCEMNGVKLTVVADDGKVYTKTSANTLTITRSRILDLGTIALEFVASPINFKPLYSAADYYQWDADDSVLGANPAFKDGEEATTELFKACPTAQEMIDYLAEAWFWDNGDVPGNGLQTYSVPTGDGSTLATDLHMGIWLSKKSNHVNKPGSVTFGDDSKFDATPYCKGTIDSYNAADIRTSGNYFFLPATGYYNGTFMLTDSFGYGYYWSRTSPFYGYAYCLRFEQNSGRGYAIVDYSRLSVGFLPMIAE